MLPVTGSSCNAEAGTAVPLKLLQGLFPGRTQALTCTSPASAERRKEVLEYPLTSVVVAEELNVADPLVKKELTVRPLSGVPLESTRAVRGTLSVASGAIRAEAG